MRATTAEIKSAMLHGTVLEREAAAFELLRSIDHHLPWLAARAFDGFNLVRKSDAWLIVLKAKKGMRPQVAFFTGEDPMDVMVVMTHQLIFDLAKWKDDKWGSMRSDKNQKPG